MRDSKLSVGTRDPKRSRDARRATIARKHARSFKSEIRKAGK